jgi:hypothetical protein
MDVGAWCGRCGESFRLAELVESGFSGRCPRCAVDLAGSYGPVVSAAVHDLLAAVGAADVAATRLRDAAPRLHVDARRLAASLAEALGEADAPPGR